MLVGLGEEELAHARAGRWEALAEATERRAALAATLPEIPPAAARPALERLAGLQDDLLALTGAARAQTADELERLRRGRGALHGYAGQGGSYASPARVDDAG